MKKQILTLIMIIICVINSNGQNEKNNLTKPLKEFKLSELKQDFEILKNAFIETRVGLWYNTYPQFDSLCKVQENKIKDKMNALDLYLILAPIVTFTKEGHCYIDNSKETNSYFKKYGKRLPFKTKIINGKVYILNDLGKFKTSGKEITKINGHSIGEIIEKFLSIEPADGYNVTSKYHWIEGSFSKYYEHFFQVSPKSFKLELLDPKTNKKITYQNIPSYNNDKLAEYFNKLENTVPQSGSGYDEPSSFTINPSTNTATLTINTFKKSKYKGGKIGFQKYLDSVFKTISNQKIPNLIIDIRKNEGGSQGMEDFLLSHLIEKPYTKYKYVEIPSFTYSFLDYTDYKNEADTLKMELKEDFYFGNDGRYLNKKGHYEGTLPNPNNFKGHLYILINGLTFSGGSEFAAMAKNYTNAIFIGEETGGGFYGNSSGSFIHYKLPNTGLTGRIPLCKFVVNDKDFGIPFGHGVIPDYQIQPTITEYLNGFDAELEFAKKLIAE